MGEQPACKPAEPVLDAFFDYLHYERRLSPRTLTGYRRDLSEFVDWLRGHAIDDWARVDSQHIRSYAATRHRVFDQGITGRYFQYPVLNCMKDQLAQLCLY